MKDNNCCQLIFLMTKMPPRGKRKREEEKSSTIELEMELNDIVYRYGGEEAIRMSAMTTPDHVLDAYTQLGRLRQQRGEYHPIII